jgi:hypothetical protein
MCQHDSLSAQLSGVSVASPKPAKKTAKPKATKPVAAKKAPAKVPTARSTATAKSETKPVELKAVPIIAAPAPEAAKAVVVAQQSTMLVTRRSIFDDIAKLHLPKGGELGEEDGRHFVEYRLPSSDDQSRGGVWVRLYGKPGKLGGFDLTRALAVYGRVQVWTSSDTAENVVYVSVDLETCTPAIQIDFWAMAPQYLRTDFDTVKSVPGGGALVFRSYEDRNQERRAA